MYEDLLEPSMLTWGKSYRKETIVEKSDITSEAQLGLSALALAVRNS